MTRASRSMLALRPGSISMGSCGVELSREAGSPISCTPMETESVPSLAIVTGTRPESPENVTVPEERARTAPVRAATSRFTDVTSCSPVRSSLRHALDWVRSRAEPNAGATATGSTSTETRLSTRAWLFTTRSR